MGQDGFYLFIKIRPVVFVPDVSQLMHHHIFDGLHGVFHQTEGERQAVFGTAGAKPGSRAGDRDAGRFHTHPGGVLCHQGWQDLLCFLPEGGLLLCCGFGMAFPPGLHFGHVEGDPLLFLL